MIWKKKQFWGTLIAVGLLAFCVKDISLSELKALSLRVDYFYLIPSVLFTYVFVIAKSLRWKLMVSRHKSLTYFRSISLYSAGLILNIIMPVLTGQVGRMFLFAKKEGLRKTFVFSTIILEIIFDAMSLVIFLFLTSLAFVFPEGYRSISIIVAGITILMLITLYLVLHYQYTLEEISYHRLRDRWPSLYIGIRKFIRSFTKGIETLRSSQHFAGTFLYSIVSWSAHTLVIYFLLKAFGFELPLAAAASVMIINTIALLIPITPGNAGTFEVAVSASLAAFSVGRSDAVLFAVALHLIDLLPVLSLGFFFLRSEKLSIREIKSRHDDGMIFDEITKNGTLVENGERL
ncbi:MAG: lysylphosphatidylglycerol synthase transmembrane domain-containing protein [candidate division Zixibacteria bacterium]|nr:lysylphosphatidylglycerol synthase transmembrane domain-containing protein [candidate division Zixibacteria bacterium]